MGRIVSLTDGVFAFALTLLVLSLVLPTVVALPAATESSRLGNALWQARGAFLGYVFVFVMISIWWVGHHRLFRYIVRYDDILVGFNLALLLEIAVMPFVLKVFVSYSSTQVAVDLFALIQIATGATLSLIWWYATWGHRLISPRLTDAAIRYVQIRLLLTPIVFAVSIGVAFVSVFAAEVIWIGVFVAQRFSRYSEAVHATRGDHPPRDL
ncbi:MAG: TMEM175 family protein [Thermoplasmata archaeon]